MGGHVVHLALVTGFQPALQVMFVLAKRHVGDTDVCETEFAAPILIDWASVLRSGRQADMDGQGNTGRGAYNSARHRSL